MTNDAGNKIPLGYLSPVSLYKLGLQSYQADSYLSSSLSSPRPTLTNLFAPNDSNLVSISLAALLK